ncbi:hypothetical protein C4D60_Mb08t29750 [Musa balbisiana]|uniref:Uncharacterized protein n=1 Tax=Musa balbisiana TaxID=52838 RepID=A0A4S8K7I9_MUSBA|nr:hypothetical protein C4D60_Mb08t29750 [Musa balbisiana]
MATSRGMPITSVLGRVEREKAVMDKSRDETPPGNGRRRRSLDQAARAARTSSFCRVSAATNRRFMA